MADNEIIAGLDLGTTKVCAIVAEQTDEGIDIIGIGSVPARGLKKGVVVNIESTVQAIRAAIEQAETMAGVEIGTVFAGIAGSHVRGMNQEGVAAISAREVGQEDVVRVLEQAKAFPLSGDRQVIHVLPQEYIVDDQDGIREPVGMSGVRLQARVHVVTAATPSIQNIIKCAERCDLHVAEVVLQPLASAEAVLSEDEKEIGVALIDIGGGTTDIILYSNGAVVHTSVIPMGGLNFTNDVATGLRTPVAEAERIKIRYGCASTKMVDAEETIEVPSVGGRSPRTLPRRVLCEIIEPRAEEVFQACRHVIAETGFGDMLAAGAVITGGTTLLDGMPEVAEEVLGMPVRRGAPTGIGGLIDVVKSPMYSTGVGLVKYGAERLRAVHTPRISMREESSPTPKVWGQRLGQWFKDVF
ncbi:MAG: cell division protein FtsA [Myxococcales bacterium]|nr:cell division protein FtsA [Myxococcales bacterium]